MKVIRDRQDNQAIPRAKLMFTKEAKPVKWNKARHRKGWRHISTVYRLRKGKDKSSFA